jgi:hypothetical protein
MFIIRLCRPKSLRAPRGAPMYILFSTPGGVPSPLPVVSIFIEQAGVFGVFRGDHTLSRLGYELSSCGLRNVAALAGDGLVFDDGFLFVNDSPNPY